MSLELSVVVPVFNEEKLVEEAMRRIRAFLTLKNYSWECLIVSDGSTDRTEELVQRSLANSEYQNFRLLSSKENQGKGATIRRGVLEARGSFILITDVDLSAPIKELDKLIKFLDQGYDLAIGSRALHAQGADVQQSFKRWLSGRIFNILVKLIVLRGFSDTQCGFKCLKKEAAQAIFKQQKLNGFSFDVEILYLAQKQGLRIKEVPVMWQQGQDSKVRLFRDSFRMTRDLFKIKRTVS